ncbi:MAG: replicative DNA helicase [Candidatus Thiodiazotropha endolucinida]|uniref:Replicative DNA helicase n=1 Tax=Candidatus Thiodiazotropha taylori TaxID=2792791 RepID=A0A9E4NJK5_9GAMM|nr:replicative DNA helicase [Candidatus Thiodiazotropha taylori]MCW4236386.1 replicative DNA helicase [Candidatus Thiodiazotropha endolucinida]
MTDQLRIPPHSIQAESAVLGGVLLTNTKLPVVTEILQIEDFYRKAHQDIFRTMQDLDAKRQPIDLVTLAEQLEKIGKIEGVGGLQYLTQIADQTPSAANVHAYAKTVKECAVRRQLIGIGSSIVEAATSLTAPIDIVNSAEAEFVKLTEKQAESGPRLVSEIANSGYLDELDSRSISQDRGLLTGFIDLDKLTNGLRSGQFVVLAARPSVGKTTLALNISENVAMRLHKTVLLFSLEMAKSELLDRFVASAGKIPLADVLKGTLSEGNLSEAMGSINEAPLFIDDSAALYISQIRARALRIKRKHGLSMVVVDYLQLVRAKAESRFQEVSEISRALKALAKELQVPIIALSQLNRDIESRPSGKPRLSDLRESGQLEQDADIVAFLYRENLNTDGEVVTLEIAKQRNGPTGKIHLASRFEYSRFDNYIGQVEIPQPTHTAFEYK